MRTTLAIGCIVTLLGAALCGQAMAVQAKVETALPGNISYDLSPVEATLIVTEAPEQGLSTAWHAYDVYKNEVGKGEVALKPAGGAAKQTVSFTPPRYGWYAVVFDVMDNGQKATGVAAFIGVTPKFPGVHTLVAGEFRDDWNDEARQAFGGFMMDRTNSHFGGPERLARTIDQAAKYGVTLLVQFENTKTCVPDHVRETVTRCKGKVKYWEIMNEPNFSMSPEKYAELVKQLYPIIKEIDPEAKVMGPDTCGVDLNWHRKFYQAGGGKFIDILSIHDYAGNESVDPGHWDFKLSELRKIMAENGDANKEIWQTERAIGGVRVRAFLGATQAIRITLQRDLLESYGVTNNHNNHYYVAPTGYNDVPTFVYSQSGPHPAALACRTRYAMIKDRNFVQRADFGPSGNKMFLALVYEGADGQTVTLRNLGTDDTPMDLAIAGGNEAELVDSFGNSKRLAISNGKLTVSVSQMPVYLRLAKDQKVTFPKIDFGKNIAPEATFTYSDKVDNDIKILTNGKLENTHSGDPNGRHWAGAFATSPQTLDITFPQKRTIDRVAVFTIRADNPHSALLDYDLQYNDGQNWVTIAQQRAFCPPSDAAKTYLCEALTWYLDTNFFVNSFKPVTTDKLRIVALRTTRGYIADKAAEEAIKFKAASEKLELREIEVYEAAR